MENSTFGRVAAAVIVQVLGSVTLLVTRATGPLSHFQHMVYSLQPLLLYGLVLLIVRVQQLVAYELDLSRQQVAVLRSLLPKCKLNPSGRACPHCRGTGRDR